MACRRVSHAIEPATDRDHQRLYRRRAEEHYQRAMHLFAELLGLSERAYYFSRTDESKLTF
jgi:hypothetical protein